MNKYIIDTSAMLSQKSDEQYRRNVYCSLWNKIDNMVQTKEIVTCSETASEVEDEEIKNWMKKNNMQIFQIDYEVQDIVRRIVTSVNTKLVDFKGNKSSADAFLIATASKFDLAVITLESDTSPKKIPVTCQKMGIKCMNILGFMEENGILL